MPSLGGLPEVPCARCERRVAGLGWGELCPVCRSERGRRASRLAGRAALISTVLAALWLSLSLPPDPTARLYGALALLVIYVIVRRIASRVAIAFLALALLAWPAGAATLAAQRPADRGTSLTIYNDGRVLVRRTVPVQVASGSSTARVPLGRLDPASLVALDSGVAIAGLSYDAGVDETSVLRRSVGRRVVFRSPTTGDTLSALVLGVDPLRLELPDGRITFSPPGLALYPPGSVAAEPTATLALRSPRAQSGLRLAYFTDGAAWQAGYQILLGGAASGTATVSGSAIVSSESLRAPDAEVQLLAGSVNRAQSPAPQMAMMDRRGDAAMLKVGEPAEEGVGGFHLYTLPGRVNVLPGVSTSIALFDPARVPYERSYLVRGVVPFWGYLPQQPDENEAPVEISYLLKRPVRGAFGARPLPGGVARLFTTDSAGRLQLIGESSTGHIAPGRDLRLSAGVAFDLTARRVQTAYVTRRDSTRAGWRTRAIAEYRVTLANGSDSAAVIDVLEERGGEWSVLRSSVPAEKLSATAVRFRVRVPARGEATLTYRLQVVW